MDTLAALRREIDALDDGILELLARRMEVARRVATYKHEAGIAVRLADRIEAVKERNAAGAAKRGLDPRYVRTLWAIIIEETCSFEEQLFAEAAETAPAS
jgi:chorismate mutase-like protein